MKTNPRPCSFAAHSAVNSAIIAGHIAPEDAVHASCAAVAAIGSPGQEAAARK
ncbi:MAG: hypothetical protein HZA80_01575 [Candidatus Taylorbacteria bacterium]|nr:hypothetical protein [Candidatus Taylorbacteria bacterium]